MMAVSCVGHFMKSARRQGNGRMAIKTQVLGYKTGRLVAYMPRNDQSKLETHLSTPKLNLVAKYVFAKKTA